MPKAIKKKVLKPSKKQEDVGAVLTKARAALSRKNIFIAIGVALLLLVVVAGYAWRVMNNRKAEGLFYEGYKLYYGLYQQRPLPESERFLDALENFKKSFDAKGSPTSLYYMANSYYNLGKYDDAASTLLMLNLLYPDDERFVPLAYYKLVLISLKREKREDALKYLETLQSYRTGSYKDLALIESGRVLEEMGKLDEAMKNYEALVKEFSGSPFAEEARLRLKPSSAAVRAVGRP